MITFKCKVCDEVMESPACLIGEPLDCLRCGQANRVPSQDKLVVKKAAPKEHPVHPNANYQTNVQVNIFHPLYGGLGTASLVLGILALVLCLIPIIGFFAIYIGIAGFFLGLIGLIIALVGRKTRVGTPLAGLLLSLAAIGLGVWLPLLYLQKVFDTISPDQEQTYASSEISEDRPTDQKAPKVTPAKTFEIVDIEAKTIRLDDWFLYMGYKVTAKNHTNEMIKLYGQFQFLDNDGFEVHKEAIWGFQILPNQSATLSDTAMIPREVASKIADYRTELKPRAF